MEKRTVLDVFVCEGEEKNLALFPPLGHSNINSNSK